MDPISAFALACNVLQVVEVGVTVVSACREIYERGSLIENDNVEDFAKNVAAANEALVLALAQTKLSARDARLKKTAEDAAQTAQELVRVLNKIKYAKGQGRGKVKAFKQAFQLLVKRPMVDKLHARLQSHEAALTSGIIKNLYLRCGESDLRQTQGFAKLDQAQKLLVEKVIENASYLRNHISNVVKTSENRLVLQSELSEQKLLGQMDSLALEHRSNDLQRKLLDSLSYPDLMARRNMIQQRVGTFGNTYTWLLKSDADNTNIFLDWLASDTGLFWLTGKPGSGKSSLMDFLHDKLTCRGQDSAALRGWTEPEAITIAFYFFAVGTSPLQRSLEGMWRSLCWQLLNQVPTLFSPGQNSTPGSVAASTVDYSVCLSGSYDLRGLKSLFLDLLARVLSERRVMILLDGLDECADRHNDLLRHIQEDVLALGVRVKICCSSRPDKIFSQILHNSPTLSMQALTHNDMEEVCNRLLGDTRAAPLIPIVISKAEGIFLWLHIVANDLQLGSISDSDNDLRLRLEQVPQGMMALFAHMVATTDPFYVQHPQPCLHLICQSEEVAAARRRSGSFVDLPLSSLELVLMVHFRKAVDTATQIHLDETLLAAVDAQCLVSSRQMIQRCGGLVQSVHKPLFAADHSHNFEGVRSNTVAALESHWTFIHRTARDFLSDDESGRTFLQVSKDSNESTDKHHARATLLSCRILCEISTENLGETDYKNLLRHVSIVLCVQETRWYQEPWFKELFEGYSRLISNIAWERKSSMTSCQRVKVVSSSLMVELWLHENVAKDEQLLSYFHHQPSYILDRVGAMDSPHQHAIATLLFVQLVCRRPFTLLGMEDIARDLLQYIVDPAQPVPIRHCIRTKFTPFDVTVDLCVWESILSHWLRYYLLHECRRRRRFYMGPLPENLRIAHPMIEAGVDANRPVRLYLFLSAGSGEEHTSLSERVVSARIIEVHDTKFASFFIIEFSLTPIHLLGEWQERMSEGVEVDMDDRNQIGDQNKPASDPDFGINVIRASPMGTDKFMKPASSRQRAWNKHAWRWATEFPNVYPYPYFLSVEETKLWDDLVAENAHELSEEEICEIQKNPAAKFVEWRESNEESR